MKNKIRFVSLLLIQLPAHAQAIDNPVNNGGADETMSIEPVTVTATRREESLQSVPVAVSVLEGGDLEQANLNHLEEIVHRVPSADFRPATTTKNVSLFMRGLGTISTSGGVEPTIATVLDGVVFAHPGQTTMDLLDLDRIEVLRGPQGTLFGKNASGGVFNIVTRDPSREQYRYARADYYTDNEVRLRAGVARELAQGWAWGSLTGLYGSYDGNVRNVYDGEDLNGFDKKGLRGKVVLKPVADLKITMAADYLDSHRTTAPVYMSEPNAGLIAPALLPVSASALNRQTNVNFQPFNDDEHWGLSGQLDWNLNGYTLTSITALRHWNNRQHQDIDMSTLSLVHDQGTVDLNQVSQEVRLVSPKDRSFEYVVGAFYQQSETRESYRRRIGVIADAAGFARFGIDRLNYAFFGEGQYHVTQSLRLIAGLRQTHDQLSYHFRRDTSGQSDFLHPAFATTGLTGATGYSGRAGWQYDLSEDAMIYATYSRAYKGPAFNAYANMWPADTQALQPETGDVYEIGLKSQAFDDRLRANLALFTARYDNYQTNLMDLMGGTPVYRLVNAGQVGSDGLELDLSFKPDTHWEFTAALAETQARVIHFNCAAGLPDCVQDRSTLPFAPEHRFTLGANFYLPLGSRRSLLVGGDYRWQSAEQFQLPQSPNTVQAAYGIFNASLAIDDAAHGWRLSLFAKNLTDQSYAAYLSDQFDGVARIVPRDDRRYFGIGYRQEF